MSIDPHPHPHHLLTVAAMVGFAVMGCPSDDTDLGTGSAATSGPEPQTSGPDSSRTTGSGDSATDEGGDATRGSASGSAGGTGGGPPRLNFELLELGTAVANTTDIAFLPGSMEFLLLEKHGVVHHFALQGNVANELGQFTMPDVYDDSDCGLISVTLDPGFAENGWVYLSQCDTYQQSAVYRVTLDPADYGAAAASKVLVIREGDSQATKPWHNVGAMGFEPDGETMWVLFGEKNRPVHGQDTSNNLGALLRIVPADEGGYVPAAGNAFTEPGDSPDIYAYGLRSPWRGLLDSKGRFIVGDVGSDAFEEINVVTGAGQNLGWGNHEGFCDGGCDDGSTDPIIAIPHGAHPYQVDDDEVLPVNSRVVWVGLEYLDSGDDPYDGALDGRILFGEMCSGYVRVLELDDDGQIVLDEHAGHLAHAPAWAQAPDGYVYAVANGGCGAGTIDKAPTKLYRAVPQR